MCTRLCSKIRPNQVSVDLPLEHHTSMQESTRYRRLTFIDDRVGIRNLNAENAAKHRRPIYTDTERRFMSKEIFDSVPNHDPSQALLDVERFENSSVSQEFSLFRGPFGVSKLPDPKQLTPNSDEEIAFLPDGWELDLNEIIETGELVGLNDELGFFPDVQEIPEDIPNNAVLAQESDTPTSDDSSDTQDAFELPPESPLTFFNHNIEAWSILSHYKDRIVPLVSPLGPGQEAPWLKLIMPCAVSILGELTINGKAANIRLALLNTLLSTSSYYLGNSGSVSAQHWKDRGDHCLNRAQYHFLKSMEETCMSSTKTSKYKEILMTILSLSTVYMIKGDSEQRLTNLTQAARFISLNGFKSSSLSPKRRSLHHCYAYMRILAETTCIMDNLSEGVDNINLDSNESPSFDFRLSPGIAFSDNILSMEKDPNVAQRDLHLAIPGRWSMTLFPKMFGVAESFLMLLSQVIRLANERDLSMLHPTEENMLNLKDFWTRAKALEKGIRILMASCTSRSTQGYEVESEIEIGNARAQAMYTALLIFFHRRIYELDARMLQQQVIAVCHALRQIQTEEAGRNDGSTATLIWPAFIAACEAVDPESQIFFSSWFDTCSTTTGLANAFVAKGIIEEIWNKRRDDGLDGVIWSWPDVLRANKIKLICT